MPASATWTIRQARAFLRLNSEARRRLLVVELDTTEHGADLYLNIYEQHARQIVEAYDAATGHAVISEALRNNARAFEEL